MLEVDPDWAGDVGAVPVLEGGIVLTGAALAVLVVACLGITYAALTNGKARP